MRRKGFYQFYRYAIWLFGLIEFPVLNKSMVSDITYGAVADIKKERVLLLRRQSNGRLWGSGYALCDTISFVNKKVIENVSHNYRISS